MGIRTNRLIGQGITYLLLILITAVFLFPVFHVVMTSFKFPIDA
jgi:ABC-type maltose transport system permease subunit